MTACPHCGAQMAEGRTLCKACGKLSTATVDPNAPVSQVPPRPVAPSQKIPTWGIVACVIAGLILTVGVFSGGRRNQPTRGAVPARSSTVRVDYLVQGTARRASLTYRNAQGGTVQKDVTLPWEERMDVGRGTFIYISAQNQGETGTVTCKILTDLSAYKETTSEGAYKIATCSGQAP